VRGFRFGNGSQGGIERDEEGLNTAGYHPSVSGASGRLVALRPEDREISAVGSGDVASYRNNLMRYARVGTV
jgi:hypothetical protein